MRRKSGAAAPATTANVVAKRPANAPPVKVRPTPPPAAASKLTASVPANGNGRATAPAVKANSDAAGPTKPDNVANTTGNVKSTVASVLGDLPAKLATVAQKLTAATSRAAALGANPANNQHDVLSSSLALKFDADDVMSVFRVAEVAFDGGLTEATVSAKGPEADDQATWTVRNVTSSAPVVTSIRARRCGSALELEASDAGRTGSMACRHDGQLLRLTRATGVAGNCVVASVTTSSSSDQHTASSSLSSSYEVKRDAEDVWWTPCASVAPRAAAASSSTAVTVSGAAALPAGRCTMTLRHERFVDLGCSGDIQVEGDFRDGVPHGNATLRVDSNLFEGAWVAGNFTGRGTHAVETPSSGASTGGGAAQRRVVYRGGFRDGQRHGEGELTISPIGASPVVSIKSDFSHGSLAAGASISVHVDGKPCFEVDTMTNAITVSLGSGKFTGSLMLDDSSVSAQQAELLSVITLGSEQPDPSVARAVRVMARLPKVMHDHGAAVRALHALEHLFDRELLGYAVAGQALVLKAYQAKASDARESLIAHVAQMRANAADREAHARQVKELGSKIATMKNQIATTTSAAQAIETKNDAIAAELSAIQKEISALTHTAEDHESSLEAAPDSPSKAERDLAVATEQAAAAKKRLTTAKQDAAAARQAVAAHEKRVAAQQQLLKDLDGQIVLARKARESAEAKQAEVVAEYDGKVAAEEEKAAALREKLAAAEASSKEIAFRLEALQARLARREEGGADEEDERVTSAEARARDTERTAMEARTALDKVREERDAAARTLSVLHDEMLEAERAEREGAAAAQAAKETLRQKRAALLAMENEAAALEEDIQRHNAALDPLNDADDEATVLEKHKKHLAAFNLRSKRARDAMAALKQEQQQQQQQAATPARAPSTPPDSLASSPTPPTSALLSQETTTKAEIDAATTLLEQLNTESKRLKALKDAPPHLQLNMSACSVPQLKAIQAKMKESIAAVEQEHRQMEAELARAKEAVTEKRNQQRNNSKSSRPIPKDAKPEWCMKSLQEILEKRDERIADLKMQAARIKQLEAKLAVANDTASGMSASADLRQQQSLSKAESDSAWASARNTAVRGGRRASDFGSSFSRSMSGTHF